MSRPDSENRGSSEPLRVGVIGTGRIASDYLGILPELASVELVAVCDIDETARNQAARQTGVAAFGSVEEMLAEMQLDAALVLTPPVSHENVTLDLLARGLHVLCEKPLAVTASAAARMQQTASRHDAVLMMASKFRYVPDLIEAQKLIADGAIGTPILIDNGFCSIVDMSDRWNSDPAISGGGVLIDNGCHSVDIVRMLIGPLVRVLAHFGRRVQPVKVEDSVRMFFETASACVGLIDISWSVEKAAEHYVSVQATEGTMQIGWQGSRYRRSGEDEWHTFGTGYQKRAALRAQVENFVGVVRGTDKPRVTPTDALASVRAIEAAYRSARVGRWVPIQGFKA